MKIAHIIDVASLGFSHSWLVFFIEQLRKNNIEGEIFCLVDSEFFQKGLYEKLFTAEKVHSLYIEKRKGVLDFKGLSQAKAIFIERRIKIFHNHSLHSLGLVAAFSWLNRIPCIHGIHGLEEGKVSPLDGYRVKKIISDGQSFKEFFFINNASLKPKTEVIFPGLDPAWVKAQSQALPKTREDFGLSKDNFVIGFFGEFAQHADFESLLKALKKLNKKENLIKLLAVGQGSLNNLFKKIAAEMGLENQVIFVENLGERGALNFGYLNLMDVVVYPGFKEEVAWSMLAASALGKPIVATKIAGYRDVVLDGVTGLLVPCGFPERIESSVMRLYVNRGLGKSMGEAGQKRFQENFSLAQMIQKYEALYRSLLK